MQKQKYFHCVYALDGEYKKLKLKRTEVPMYMMNCRSYLAYLRTWPLSKSSCRLDRKIAKYYIQHWKNKTKTKLMKDILKQLRTI